MAGIIFFKTKNLELIRDFYKGRMQKKVFFLFTALFFLFGCNTKTYNIKTREKNMIFQEIKISGFKKGPDNIVSIDVTLENPSSTEKWLLLPLPFNEVLEEKIFDYSGVLVFHFKEDAEIKYVEVRERWPDLYGYGLGKVGFIGFLLSPKSKIEIKNFKTRVFFAEVKKVEVLTANNVTVNGKPFSEVYANPLSMKNCAEIKNGGETDIEWIEIFPDLAPSASLSSIPGVIEIDIEKRWTINFDFK